eukprot:gnl/MRDRNA2_/MRDRNA2_146753_c0_seq1.p1 gnl/MRDRNA2_/MRDRNA2_146753_c0~~gnl/MRDRNA2_/MRDRNA2_146753_c0_seq1.p1  ORF type:complete len:192 (-),score=43.31 gnl/MRDRNA2_/MRDRNA2_146753_c0_seq1:143-691(-)
MIPQEPLLMQGSVRKNLDPFEEHEEAAIEKALCQVGVRLGLSDEITLGGGNLSAGERQLLSFSRVLLRDAKVVLLDEPTSSIDPLTDLKMQELVRNACVGRTVITIAHRLRTILDSDMIVVLGNGRVLEIGAPQKLMSDPSSQYSQMLRLAGETEETKGSMTEGTTHSKPSKEADDQLDSGD